jgi:hypothetical protein
MLAAKPRHGRGEFRALEGLLYHRCIGCNGRQAFPTIASDNDEGYASFPKQQRDSLDAAAIQIRIGNDTIPLRASDLLQSFGLRRYMVNIPEPGVFENRRDFRRDDEFVLNDENAFALQAAPCLHPHCQLVHHR